MWSDFCACPACGRVFAPDEEPPAVCGRCEADLTACRRVTAEAANLRRRALLQLPDSPAMALRLVRRARLLHDAPAARSLYAILEYAASRPQSPGRHLPA